MWLRWMMLAFLANGLGPFGLKVLAEAGLSESFRYQYLVFWYAGGFALAFGVWMGNRVRWAARELWIALVMALGSVLGQLFTSLALERGVPGHVVFPVTTGGNLFLVSAAGMLLFKERIGPYGVVGILTGIASLVLLSLG